MDLSLSSCTQGLCWKYPHIHISSHLIENHGVSPSLLQREITTTRFSLKTSNTCNNYRAYQVISEIKILFMSTVRAICAQVQCYGHTNLKPTDSALGLHPDFRPPQMSSFVFSSMSSPSGVSPFPHSKYVLETE